MVSCLEFLLGKYYRQFQKMLILLFCRIVVSQVLNNGIAVHNGGWAGLWRSWFSHLGVLESQTGHIEDPHGRYTSSKYTHFIFQSITGVKCFKTLALQQTNKQILAWQSSFPPYSPWRTFMWTMPIILRLLAIIRLARRPIQKRLPCYSDVYFSYMVKLLRVMLEDRSAVFMCQPKIT